MELVPTTSIGTKYSAAAKEGVEIVNLVETVVATVTVVTVVT